MSGHLFSALGERGAAMTPSGRSISMGHCVQGNIAKLRRVDATPSGSATFIIVATSQQGHRQRPGYYQPDPIVDIRIAELPHLD